MANQIKLTSDSNWQLDTETGNSVLSFETDEAREEFERTSCSKETPAGLVVGLIEE